MIRPLVRSLVRWARSDPRVKRLLYEAKNTGEFSDLYQHERMLADPMRMRCYERMIQRHVPAGAVVIDVGTGSGILAFLAARRARRVYAIDHSGFIEVARLLAERNGLRNIEFVSTHSGAFTPPEPADVLLHEQMGGFLFDEHMVENLLDLKRRALEPGGTILPSRFEVYLEPVTLKDDHRVPYLWENRVGGVDYSALEGRPELARYRSATYGRRFLENGAVSGFLAEPEPIQAFDLNTLSAAAELPAPRPAARRIRRAGRLDGLCFYFRVIFDGDTVLSTSPSEPRTNWGSILFRCERRECREGEVLEYALTWTDPADVGTWKVEMG